MVLIVENGDKWVRGRARVVEAARELREFVDQVVDNVRECQAFVNNNNKGKTAHSNKFYHQLARLAWALTAKIVTSKCIRTVPWPPFSIARTRSILL